MSEGGGGGRGKGGTWAGGWSHKHMPGFSVQYFIRSFMLVTKSIRRPLPPSLPPSLRTGGGHSVLHVHVCTMCM